MTFVFIFVAFSVVGWLSLPSSMERQQRSHVHFSAPFIEWYFHSPHINRDLFLGAVLFFPLLLVALLAQLAFEVAVRQVAVESPVVLVVVIACGLIVGHGARRFTWPVLVRKFGVSASAVQPGIQPDGPASGGSAG